MTEERTAKTTKKSFRWAKLLLIVVVLFAMVRLGDKVKHYADMCDEAEAYRDKLVEAQAHYDQRQQEVELLNNPSYMERLARERLGMVMQGETVVSIVETPTATPTQN